MLTEGRRNANDQAFARKFLGQVDLVARRVLHQTVEVGEGIAHLHSHAGGRVEVEVGVGVGKWSRADGSSRSWNGPVQRSCLEHGVNGVKYLGGA